jgi:hypothetical protein
MIGRITIQFPIIAIGRRLKPLDTGIDFKVQTKFNWR